MDPFSHPIFDDDDFSPFNSSSPYGAALPTYGSANGAAYYSPPPTYAPQLPWQTPPTPPTPTASVPMSNPRQATGQSQLGRDIAARVQGAVSGNRGSFGGYPGGVMTMPGRPSPPNVPNAFDLGTSIRSRVAQGHPGMQGGVGGRTPFPTPGQTPSMPNLPGADLGAQIRSRVSGGQWGTPQPPAMPQTRMPTQPGMSAAPAAPAPSSAASFPSQGQTGRATPVDQAFTPAPMEPGVPMSSTTTAAPAPAPAGGGSFGAPQGAIPQGHITGGGDWNNVNQYDATFVEAGNRHGVDPAMLKSMMIVESGGAQGAIGAGGAMGAMQVKPEVWGAEAAAQGYDLNTVEGQIGTAAAILGGDTWNAGGTTPEEIFLSTYYPIPGGLDVPGESGHTQRQYLEDMAMYTEQINAAGGVGGGVAPVAEAAPAGVVGGAPIQDELMAQGVGPVPLESGAAAPAASGGFAPPMDDVVSTISGGVYAAEDIGYGFKAQAPDYAIAAGYYADYGDWDETKHTGVDIPGAYGQEFVTPVGGTVTCSSTGVGAGSWGSGCAAFGDDQPGGAGRIEVMMDNGVSVIYGHTSGSYVSEGQQINPGDPVGTMGWLGESSDGGHVHLETRVWCDGAPSYTIVDPNVAMYSTDPQADFCSGY